MDRTAERFACKVQTVKAQTFDAVPGFAHMCKMLLDQEQRKKLNCKIGHSLLSKSGKEEPLILSEVKVTEGRALLRADLRALQGEEAEERLSLQTCWLYYNG